MSPGWSLALGFGHVVLPSLNGLPSQISAEGAAAAVSHVVVVLCISQHCSGKHLCVASTAVH